MTFTTLVTDLAQILGVDSADTTMLANLKRWLNTAYKDLAARYRWSFLKSQGVFQTVLAYETGTVTVTSGSRTVTGDGTAFTSAMVGRYFNCSDNSDWYKIVAVASGTSLTLEVPYAWSTASSKKFTIWKKAYSLNTDVSELLDMFPSAHSGGIKAIAAKDAEYIQHRQGSPFHYMELENTTSTDTYTTGTVAGTINTKTLTGTSTSWLDNARPGDDITIGSYTYQILTVNSDTSITLCQNLVAAVTGGTSYSISRTDLKQVMLDFTPTTYVQNIYYKYHRKVYDLQNDSDVPSLPARWHDVITLGASYIAYQSLDDSRRGEQLQLYEGKIKQMIKEETSKSNQPNTWTR